MAVSILQQQGGGGLGREIVRAHPVLHVGGLFLQPGGQALLADRRDRDRFAGALDQIFEQGNLILRRRVAGGNARDFSWVDCNVKASPHGTGVMLISPR
jgi:hypothetical protein